MPLLFLHDVTGGMIVAFRLRLVLHPNVNRNFAGRLISNRIYLLLPGIYDPTPCFSQFTMSKRADALKVSVPTYQRCNFFLFVFGKAARELPRYRSRSR